MQKIRLVEGITSKILTPKQGPKARDHPLYLYKAVNRQETDSLGLKPAQNPSGVIGLGRFTMFNLDQHLA